MTNVISVIVPVYNVAAYLPECLHSILEQDYRDLEVIVIDDGSTDASGAICDAWAARDSRIRVIHQKNGGAAAAKNAGLRGVTGAYLSFVDSDDYLDVYRDRKEDQLRGTGLEILSAADYLLRYTTDWICGLMTDKLYRRAIFNGIFFEEGHKIDDEYFTYRGIMNAGKVLCDDRIIYNYRKRRSSVMFSPESAARILLDRVDYLDKRRRNVVARFPELRRVYDLHFLDSMLYLSTDRSSSAQSIAAYLFSGKGPHCSSHGLVAPAAEAAPWRCQPPLPRARPRPQPTGRLL